MLGILTLVSSYQSRQSHRLLRIGSGLNQGPAIPSREELFDYIRVAREMESEDSIEPDNVELQPNEDQVVEKVETFVFRVKKSDLERARKSKSSVDAVRDRDFASKFILNADMVQLLEEVEAESYENGDSQIHYRIDLDRERLDEYISSSLDRLPRRKETRKSTVTQRGLFYDGSEGMSVNRATFDQRRKRKLHWNDYIPSLVISVSELKEAMIHTAFGLAALAVAIWVLSEMAALFWLGLCKALQLVVKPLQRRSLLIRKITSIHFPVAFICMISFWIVNVSTKTLILSVTL